MKYALSQERSASHVREKAFKHSSWKLFRKLCLFRIPHKLPGDLMTFGVNATLSTSTTLSTTASLLIKEIYFSPNCARTCEQLH